MGSVSCSDDYSRCSNPSVVDNDVLKAFVDTNPKLTLDEMKYKTETIPRHLEKINKV